MLALHKLTYTTSFICLMKDTTRICWLLFLFIPTHSLLAQERITENLISQPKWEVGMDLLWLIDKNTLPKYTLLVRRQIGQHGAIRLRGGYLKNSNYLAFRELNYNTASLIRIGYEYQKPLSTLKGNTKSMLYGGVDYFWRYENNLYEIYNVQTPAPTTGTGLATHDITHERGGAAFIGFKYFVTSYLSFSVESSFQISHVDYSQEEQGFNSAYYAYNELPRDSYQFLPLNTLMLSFHF